MRSLTLKTEKFPVFSAINREFLARSPAKLALELPGATERRDSRTAHCASLILSSPETCVTKRTFRPRNPARARISFRAASKEIYLSHVLPRLRRPALGKRSHAPAERLGDLLLEALAAERPTFPTVARTA